MTALGHAQASDSAIRRVAGEGGLELSGARAAPTASENLVHQGKDLVMGTEIAGHVRIKTTHRYSLPSKTQCSGPCHQPQSSPLARSSIGSSDGEAVDRVLVALLGVGERARGVDLERLSGGVA
jgi:hypothetical protein